MWVTTNASLSKSPRFRSSGAADEIAGLRSISDQEAGQRYSAVSGSVAETESHVSLWRAIREGRLATVTDNVERILGRKPIPLDQWAIENAAAFC
jgi:hypothetical protein